MAVRVRAGAEVTAMEAISFSSVGRGVPLPLEGRVRPQAGGGVLRDALDGEIASSTAAGDPTRTCGPTSPQGGG
ncbi:hypothetical protein MPLDJ20_210088 [Mesorhizobium plurifarium]|uniref:Uncharacterized protein n=1 Tax=Mesorhizobium plurifarium TaxID=69974 RepID=A0A090F240_MESPL|nr:hypothetical protein MPLDJ20_210088 [Mesorhizobium plurifarium]